MINWKPQPEEISHVRSCATLTDLNTGEEVEIISPSYFELETVLVNSGYYRFHQKLHRFRLSEARVAGLRIDKTE